MPTIKSIWRRSGWLSSSFQRSEARSLRSLSRTPEAKDLLASGGDWLGCGGDKAIVSVRLEIHPFDEFPGVGRIVHLHQW